VRAAVALVKNKIVIFFSKVTRDYTYCMQWQKNRILRISTLQQFERIRGDAEKFSKVSARPNVLYAMAEGMTFENFHGRSGFFFVGDWGNCGGATMVESFTC